MRKIFLIIYLILQNTLLFASQADTLTIHEKETRLLTHNYFFELEDPPGSYKIRDIISNTAFHPVSSSLPILSYSKSITWLKFVLKNKTTRAFVPINIGPGVIDNFDIYYADPDKSKHIINLTSDI